VRATTDQACRGQKAKRALCRRYEPFGIGGIWENWKDPGSGGWVRTFAIITTDANSQVADIHDRMPLILGSEDHGRWLGDEPDPADRSPPS
jgi:putative SOS response-associated peptidase YedK